MATTTRVYLARISIVPALSSVTRLLTVGRSLGKALALALLLMASNIYAGTVTSVTIKNGGGSKTDVPITFGQVFKPGDVPSGATLGLRISGATSLPTQVERKATHSDGSLRHAIITTLIPDIASQASITLNIETPGNAASGSPVTLADVQSSNLDAEVRLTQGGTLYALKANDLLTNSTTLVWQSGPIVSEWIVGGALKAADGTAHKQLRAYFHIRAYQGLSRARVDFVIENGTLLGPGSGTKTYDVELRLGGQSVYSSTNLSHYHNARWHKAFWWGQDPDLYVQHDKYYLQETKAIPRYEDISPTEGFLNSVRNSTSPMDNGDHQNNMQDTGFQQGIGPLPNWDAVFAISTDKRAYHYMLANADGGGAYSTHFRDENTGLPVSIDDFPNTSIADPAAASKPFNNPGGNPYYEGNWASHQPSIGYLPYIVTGDYYYLEELQFWSAYNLVWPSPSSRNGSAGWWYTDSLRGQAWAYRSLAQAAYITPDDHPMKSYFLDKLDSNIQRDHSLYVSPGGPHKNNLGAMYMGEGNNEYRFYDYFMSWVTQYLVDLGFTQAIPLRDYKLRFPIGLMGKDPGEFCFQSAARYTWNVGTGTNFFYANFGEVYVNTVSSSITGLTCGSQAMANALGVGVNEMDADQFSTTYYFANLQPALAAAYDSGLPGGVVAWDRAHLSGVHPDYRDQPIWAVIPHNLDSNSPKSPTLRFQTK